jgi:hypothetical protein
LSDEQERLRDVLERAASAFEGVDRAQRGADVELSARGQPFAVIGADRAQFRLGRPVAAAALRTPDTVTSGRGAEWVVFSPAELDRHAIDRAEAWLASAWRRASAGE